MSGVSGDGIGNGTRQVPEPVSAEVNLADWSAAIGSLRSDPAGSSAHSPASVAAEPGIAAALSGTVERAPGELLGQVAEAVAPALSLAAALPGDAGLPLDASTMLASNRAAQPLSGGSGPGAAEAATQAPVLASFETASTFGFRLPGDIAGQSAASPFLSLNSTDPGLSNGNPLLAWGLASVLGGPDRAPLWTAMGITPQELADRLQSAPWEVAAFQLGRAVTARQYDALVALPGPLGALLRVGVDPRAALTLQAGWEAVMFGGRDPFAGRELPPLWQQFGLASHDELRALATALQAGAAALPEAGPRPSVEAQRLLGAAPILPPPLPQGSIAALIALPGAGFAGFHPASAAELGTSTAAVLIGAADGELLLARNTPVISARDATDASVLSAFGNLHGNVQGPQDQPDTLRFGDVLRLHLGVAGETPFAVASWSPEAGFPPASLLPVLRAVLNAAPAGLRAADILLPLYGPETFPSGTIALDTGATVAFGMAPPMGFTQAVPPSALPLVGLQLRGSLAPSSGPAPRIVHEMRRPVPIDLTPLDSAVPLWRIDDTRILVDVGPGGSHEAAQRAATLCQALTGDAPDLGLLQAGEGFSTWAGSPLWLALAGIAKPLAMGVLPEARPPRVEFTHTVEGEWLVSHAGDAVGAMQCRLHPRQAVDSEALLQDLLYAMPEEPETNGLDSRAQTSLEAFRAARAWMAAATGLGDRDASLRAMEAWAGVARDCAAVLNCAGADNTVLSAAHAALAGAEPDAGPALDRAGFLTLMRRFLDRGGGALSRYGLHAIEAVRVGEIDGIGPAERTAIAACLGRLVGPLAGVSNPLFAVI